MSQTVSISFSGPLNTKIDPKLLPVGQFTTAQNVVYTTPGAVVKRFGQALLPQAISGTTNTITAATSFGRFKDELLLFDGATLYGFGTAGAAWVPKASLTEVSVGGLPVVQNVAGSRNAMSSCIAAGLEVYAWEDTRGGVRYSVRDQTSGVYYVADGLVDVGGSLPQVVRSSSFIDIFYSVGPAIYGRQVQINNPQALTPATFLLTSNVGGLRAVAVAPSVGSGADGRIFIAYMKGTSLILSAFGGNLINQFNAFAVNGIADCCAGLSVNSTAAWLALSVSSASSQKLQVWDTSLNASTTASATGFSGFGRATVAWTSATDTLTAFFDGTNTTFVNDAVQTRLATNSSGTVAFTGAVFTLQGVQLASCAFSQGGVAMAVTASPNVQKLVPSALSIQTSYYLVNQSGKILLRFFAGEAAGGFTVISQASAIDAHTWQILLPFRQQLRADSAGTVFASTGGYSVRLNFPTVSKLCITEFNTTAIISCGNVYVYDGSQVVESGFWEFPEGILATLNGTGSGNLNAAGIPATTYQYVCVNEWADNAGNIHYSSPSFPVTVSPVATNDSVTLTIPTMSLTLRTGVVIGVYRAIANSSGPYYRIAELVNNPAVTSLTYTDTASDLSISGGVYLYAPPDGSGELENDAPPPFLTTVATKTRVFGLSAENPSEVWYTKPVAPGRPPEWNAGQVQRVEAAGGDGTALGAMDTLLVLFKSTRIYYLPGDGPNAGGQPANGFRPFQLISSASGCSSPGSIIPTDKGLFYKSQRGIEMLDRALTTQYQVGFPVDSYRTLAINCAMTVPEQNQVRFGTSNTGLWYDYALDRWSTATNHDAVGSAYWRNTYVRCNTSGQVWQENSATYLDNSSAVAMVLETGWIPISGSRQGYGRIRWLSLLGNYTDSHLLNIQFGFDYQDYSFMSTWNPQTGLFVSHYGDSVTYGSDALYGGLTAAAYQVRARMPRQKCQAIRLRFSDSAVTGGSCALAEYALEFSEKSGLARLPAGQTV